MTVEWFIALIWFGILFAFFFLRFVIYLVQPSGAYSRVTDQNHWHLTISNIKNNQTHVAISAIFGEDKSTVKMIHSIKLSEDPEVFERELNKWMGIGESNINELNAAMDVCCRY